MSLEDKLKYINEGVRKDDKIIGERGGDNGRGVTIGGDDGQSGTECDYDSEPEGGKHRRVTSSCTFRLLAHVVKLLNEEQRVIVEEANFGNVL